MGRVSEMGALLMGGIPRQWGESVRLVVCCVYACSHSHIYVYAWIVAVVWCLPAGHVGDLCVCLLCVFFLCLQDMLETGCGITGPGMNPGCAHANNRQPNMTATEYKTEFSMWAISASPLIFTSPIMNCSTNTPPLPTCAVTLKAQHSNEVCTLGTNFGCWAGNQSMWTSQGCRGEFICNGNDITCDVNGTGMHSCSCNPNAGVTCVPWISDVQREILFNTEVRVCVCVCVCVCACTVV